MNRRRFFGLAAGLGTGVWLAGRAAALPPELRRCERTCPALGTHVSLTAYHEDAAVAELAIEEAFRALDRIENVLSLHRPESDLCRLNRDGHLDRPHPDLVRVLGEALDWAGRTEGAFDPTVQPLWNLYARREPGTPRPTAAEVEAARRRVDWRRCEVRLDRIRLGPGQSVTLNGIAQGFAADRVRNVLRAHGIRHALADTGEFAVLGRKPDGTAWRAGIQHPRLREAYVALADLDDRFLATSGDYEAAFSDDFSSHHIFDPATGRSPSRLASVTVLAPTGLEADALSTAMFVLGPGPALELAARRKGVDALLVLKSGEVVKTPNFPEVA